MGMHHTIGQVEGEGLLIASFKILNSAGTPSITEVLGPAGQSIDFSITDTNQGIYDVTIANFKGKQGIARVFVTPYTESYFAGVSARSYSGDTLSITIEVNDDASAHQDSSLDVLVLAY